MHLSDLASLRCPQSFPPLPFDCCDSSVSIGDLWKPPPPALGAAVPAAADTFAGIDYYAW